MSSNDQTILQDVTLVFTPEHINALAYVLDSSLRNGGMQAMPHVQMLSTLMAEGLNKQ